MGGDKCIVDVNESKFGRIKINRWDSVGVVWVISALNRTDKRIVLQPVKQRNKEIVTNFCTKFIDSRFVIYSDRRKGCIDLFKYFSLHQAVNHSKGFVVKQTGIHTNTIEGNCNAIKKSISVRCRTLN